MAVSFIGEGNPEYP